MKILHRKNVYTLGIIILILTFLLLYLAYSYKTGQLQSIIISFIGSFICFGFLNFMIYPRVQISEEIRKVIVDNDNYFFEYAVHNSSHFLELRDINVCYIINTPYNDQQINHSSKDKLALKAIEYIPYLSCRSNEFLSIIIRYEDIEEYLKSKSDTYNHVLNNIISKEQKVIGIDLFLNKPGCDFQLVLHGYSRFTGVKKTYVSKPYTKDKIRVGDCWDRGKVSNCKKDKNDL